MVSNEKVAISPAAPTSSEDDAVTHLFRYIDHQRDTLYINVVARCGVVVIPCTLAWSSYGILMILRRSATADGFYPAAEKR